MNVFRLKNLPLKSLNSVSIIHTLNNIIKVDSNGKNENNIGFYVEIELPQAQYFTLTIKGKPTLNTCNLYYCENIYLIDKPTLFHEPFYQVISFRTISNLQKNCIIRIGFQSNNEFGQNNRVLVHYNH